MVLYSDLLHVQVVCPPDIGAISVLPTWSIRIVQVNGFLFQRLMMKLAGAYTSSRYPGLRDYVSLRGVTQRTKRNVSLFMPYDATAMPKGSYLRRYVIRLWDSNDQDVERRPLPTEKVTVANQSGRTIIKVVRVQCMLRS